MDAETIQPISDVAILTNQPETDHGHHFFSDFAPYTGGAASVEAPGETVADVLNALTTTHEGLARHLRMIRASSGFVNVYLGDETSDF